MTPFRRLVSVREMLLVSAHELSRATYQIGLINGIIRRIGERQPQEFGAVTLGPDDANVALESLKSLLLEVEKLEARMTAITVKRVIRLIESNECGVYDFQVLVEEAERRLFDELDGRFVFALDAKEAQIYGYSFGKEVETNFPSIVDEIGESYKCYALGRSTAATFHAIRCLECGVAALWRSLGIADPISGFERNWGNRSRKIECQIEQKWPAKSGRMSGDAKFFDEALGAITGMQNPYRNATMHLDAKYTPEEAWHIMELVKGFMQKIASRMDENGLPLA